MADTSSVKGKSDSSKDELQESPADKQKHIFELEQRELAKHRLRQLKDSFEAYIAVYNNYLQRHYLILALCSVVILIGIIIVFLKFVGKESLLNTFKAIQSSFASVVSGGSIIAFGSSILFSDKKDVVDDTKYEPKEDTIRLCIERNLGKKMDKTTKKLLKKKDDLEVVKSLQSICATIASIIALFLVGVDFLGLLPDIKYIDIGLDCLLSLIGAYFFFGACIINSILPDPRNQLRRQNFVTLIFVIIPCAFLVGLINGDIFEHKFFETSGKVCWMKEICLSIDERNEIMYLLRGLNPYLILWRVENFCKELNPEKSNERTPLIEQRPKLIESVNKMEFETKQRILNEYFSFGEALVERLKGQTSNDTQREQSIMEIVNKFPSTETEEIRKHYIELDKFIRGLTLDEFFYNYPRKMQDLTAEEVTFAHNALKIYAIFNGIGRDKIKLIKTFSATTIGKFNRDEIVKIVHEFRHGPSDVSIKIDI